MRPVVCQCKSVTGFTEEVDEVRVVPGRDVREARVRGGGVGPQRRLQQRAQRRGRARGRRAPAAARAPRRRHAAAPQHVRQDRGALDVLN